RLVYEMKRLQAAMGALEDGAEKLDDIKGEVLDVSRKLLVTVARESANLALGDPSSLLSAVSDIGIEVAQKAWNKAVRCYREGWYKKTIDVKVLAAMAIAQRDNREQHEQSTKKLQERINEEKDWQLFYAGLEVLKSVAENGTAREGLRVVGSKEDADPSDAQQNE
ncbi:MAG: hypothetical protein AAF320_06445, partial [Myxococcota bacterium]